MEDVKQCWFPWAAPIEKADPHGVVLDPETTAVTIALLARALITVVRAIEEVDRER